MGGGGNSPEFWGEIIWTVVWIVMAFLAATLAVGIALIGFGAGWI